MKSVSIAFSNLCFPALLPNLTAPTVARGEILFSQTWQDCLRVARAQCGACRFMSENICRGAERSGDIDVDTEWSWGASGVDVIAQSDAHCCGAQPATACRRLTASRRLCATNEELELIADILTITNTETSRILSTESAIEVFERSDLSRSDLREIWRLADKDRNGLLTSKELAIALRLIGWVQAGRRLDEHLIELPGPSPTLRGISDVRKTHGPAVAPFSSPRQSRSSTLPATTGHVAGSKSVENVNASNLLSPPSPPVLKTAKSEPLASIEDDLPTPIVGLPPTPLHHLTFLTSPRSTRPFRRLTDQNPRPATSVNPFSPPVSASAQQAEIPVVPDPVPEIPVAAIDEPIPENIVPSSSPSPPPPPTPPPPLLPAPPSPVAEAAPSPLSGPVPVPEELQGPQASAPSTVPPSPSNVPEIITEEDEISRLKEMLLLSGRKVEEMENRLKDHETTIAQILGATEDERKGAEQALADAMIRISELEHCQIRLKNMTELAETVKQDLERTKKEKAEDLQALSDTIAEKDKEISKLEQRAAEAEESKRLVEVTSTTVQRMNAENLRLTRRLEDSQRSFGEEKTKLTARIQELEVLAAELQWSEAEVGLQHALEEASIDNDSLKQRGRELEEMLSKGMQDREKQEAELNGLQRQLVELRRENARLALDSAQAGNGRRSSPTSPAIPGQRSEDSNPPPAYDDAVFV